MTRTADTLGGKLRRWFLGFAAVIPAVLWLLQTVLLGSAYDAMLICRVRRGGGCAQLPARRCPRAGHQGKRSGELAAHPDHGPGRGNPRQRGRAQRALHAGARRIHGQRPYRAGEALSWQAGAQHSLPTGCADFLARLQASESGTVGFRTEDGASFVCGAALSALDAVLYMSAPLGAVGAASAADGAAQGSVWPSPASC